VRYSGYCESKQGVTRREMKNMPRVARRLPIASSGGEPKINFSDADWRRIERAYGHKLPSKLHQEFLEITTQFVYFEVFERTAEPLSWATDRIQRVKKSAGHFYKALVEDAHHGSDACVYANHLIKRNFHEPRVPAGDMLHHLLITLVVYLSVLIAVAIGQLGKGASATLGLLLSLRVFALGHFKHGIVSQLARLDEIDRSRISKVEPPHAIVERADDLESAVASRPHLQG
jgi:hypothetical protein